jgi:hypothetical protein
MKKNALTNAVIAGIAGVAGIASVANAVNLNPDGLGGFTYVPNPGFVGADSFTYRAQANVIPPPGAPNLVNSEPATVIIRVETLDYDHDGDVELNDFRRFVGCMGGAESDRPSGSCMQANFVVSDADGDGDVDLYDYAALQSAFTAAGP